jgi:hypothetical protein
MKAHGKRGRWWATLDLDDVRYPTVGSMRINEHSHYEQAYSRGKAKSDALIEAIQRLKVVIVANETLLDSGTFERVTPNGHIWLFEALNFKVTCVGMRKILEFDLGECLIALDG